MVVDVAAAVVEGMSVRVAMQMACESPTRWLQLMLRRQQYTQAAGVGEGVAAA